MKILSALLVAALAFAATPAFAARACYTPDQMRAEQLLRLHSELMVVAITCRQGSRGQDLPAAYVDFTKHNIGILHGAEQTMIGYYRTHDRGDPTSHLDRLRTLLGNEFGQESADMSAPAFCAAFRDDVVKYDAASRADIDNAVTHMEVADRSYEPLCGSKATEVAKR
ncbi:MAG: hypothetical protein KGI37_09270 [Alphaproteobacteria bacterium]|nr:hypothetical protein [Alphaproteobacteria bacterium]